MSLPIQISAIVSNFNGAKYLPKLLETLHCQRGVDIDIVIVDRNSTDESHAILAKYPGVNVVQEPPESGLVTGYAIGAATATSDLLFFCNEDMWFDPDCLRLLSARIDLSRRNAATDPWQWSYDGQTWIHGGTRFQRTILNVICPYPFRRYDFTVPLVSGDVVPFACAGAMMIHRYVYEAIGGWDRRFFLDHEDVDLFLRAWQSEWNCVTVPEAKVYHAVNVSNNSSISGGKQLVSRRRYISGRSSVPILAVKYFSPRFAAITLLLWLVTVGRHLVKGHFTRTWWNLLAVSEFVRRLGSALTFRWTSRKRRKVRSGENFFREPKFQK